MKYIKAVKVNIAINSYRLMGNVEVIINNPIDQKVVSDIICAYLDKFNIDKDLVTTTANTTAEYIVELTKEFDADNKSKAFTVALKGGNEYEENIRIEINTLHNITLIGSVII